MAYAPMAAFLVAMFPLRIRYTSLSLPYHLGFGIFGGLSPYFATYLSAKASESGNAAYYLLGLHYPLALMAISIVVSVIYLKENNARFSLYTAPASVLNPLRKWLGLVWIALAMVIAWYGFIEAGIPKLFSGHGEDVVFGLIITLIITPIAVFSLFFFGKYSLEGSFREG